MYVCGIRLRPLLATLFSLPMAAALGVLGLSGCGSASNTYSPLVKNTGVQPAFTLAVTPGSATVTPGNTANYTVTITETGGFNSPITLSASGLPSGATATFGELTATAGGLTASLAIATSNTEEEAAIVATKSKLARPIVGSSSTRQVTPVGLSTITVTAAGGGITQSANVSLSVTASPDFTIAITPSTVSVQQQVTAKYTVTITALNGFTIPSITLAAPTGLPANTNATYGTATTTPTSESVPLSIQTSTDDQTPVGNSTFTVSASGSGVTHSASAVLTVTTPPDFTITLAPASVGSGIVVPGGTAKYVATLTSIAGFSTPVNLALSGNPSNTTVTLGSTTVTPTATGATTTVNVVTSENEGNETNMGVSTLLLIGTAGSTVHSATAALNVGSFTLTVTEATPGSGTVQQGQTAHYIVTVTSVNGFAPLVTLTQPALPTGCKATFGVGTITPTASGATTTLTITTTGSGPNTTPTGTLDFNVGGQGGGWNTDGSDELDVTSNQT